MDYAERTGSHVGRMITSYVHLGFANVLNGAWHDALEVRGTALTIGKERRLLALEGGCSP